MSKMSESLISVFRKQEWFTLFKSGKTGNWNLDIKIHITLFGFDFTKKSKSLFQKGDESICLSSLFTKRVKRAICSFKKSERAICSLCQKTSDSNEKPKSKFPTLILTMAMVKLNMNPKMVSINLFSVSLNSYLFVPMSSSPETN